MSSEERHDPDVGPKPYGHLIESVDTSARILLMLRGRRSIRAADVARELGVARSTAHRMVSTLQNRGLLAQDPDDKSFGPGMALVELGIAVLGAADLVAAAQPYLDRLAEVSGETVHLLIRQRDEVVFVAGAEGRHVVRAALRVGSRMPAHVTAGGRCLLANLPPERVSELYPSPRLTGGTAAALHRRQDLLEDLRAVGRAGYAVNEAQSEESLVAVASPLLDAQGVARGAISVSGPTDRMRGGMDQLRDGLVLQVHQAQSALFGSSG